MYPSPRISVSSQPQTTEWVTRGLPAVTLSVLILNLLRGVHLPNDWALTHFFITNDLGNVKRGIIGTIFTHLNVPTLHSSFSLNLLCMGVAGLTWYLFARTLLDRSRDRPAASWLLLGLSASPAIPYLAHLTGYADYLGLLSILIAVKLKRPGWLAAFAVIALGFLVFVHEGVALYTAPFLGWLLWRVGSVWERHQRSAACGLVLLVGLVGSFVVAQTSISATAAQSLFESSQATADMTLRRDVFDVLSRDVDANRTRMDQLWSARRSKFESAQSLVVLLPFMLAASAGTLKHCGGSRLERALAMLAILAPCSMFLVGGDIHRWLALTSVWAALAFIATLGDRSYHCNQSPISPPWCIALLAWGSMSSLPFFDGKQMRSVPFVDVQQWGMQLIRDIRGNAKTSELPTKWGTNLEQATVTLDLPGEMAKAIVEGAMVQVEERAAYTTGYFRLDYPMGDLPRNQGVCTDVVIRALRHAGFDLQQLMHEDIRAHGSTYLRVEGSADRNIDHRRCPNQRRFFERHGQTLTTQLSEADRNHWQPGDIVYWKLDNGLDHTGVVSHRIGESGWPMVVHNLSVTSLEDCLGRWKIVAHHRYP